MHRPSLRRRDLLASTALLLADRATARTVHGALPWEPGAPAAPVPVRPGPWEFLTPEEAAAVEALVDRLIPPDDGTPGGRDAGCAVFIDRQLAGPYGSAEGLYMRAPFLAGTPEQGYQGRSTPAARFRDGLGALIDHVRAAGAGRRIQDLPPAEQDRLLTAMEKGELPLEGADARGFFGLLHELTIEGFFADPVYGGNRDLCGWRLIGFPGVRYDYRDWVGRHNERYPLPPVGIGGRAEWRAGR